MPENSSTAVGDPPTPTETVCVETYGCQMNVLDSELVQDQLGALGYRFTDTAEQATIVLLNTCSVRELAEHKVWSRLGRFGVIKRSERPDLIVGVLGCMAEYQGDRILRRMPHVDVLCGPSQLDRLPTLLANAVAARRCERSHAAQVALAGHARVRGQPLAATPDGIETLDLSRTFSPRLATVAPAQAYVRITRGCNKLCSFCVVPYARGPELHRRPEAIVDEVRRLVDAGVVEVTLIGQTVNHYRYTDGTTAAGSGSTTTFADLLWRVHEQVPELPRLRFVTSFPRDFGDDALDVMAAAPRICRYLHIPAQSGSDRLLRLMNRGHTVQDYLDLVERARSRMPDIRLAGDMIVGFPTETDADHRASVQLLHAAQYKSCFVFKYSPRPGTVAARRHDDDVPEAIKKQRNLELLEVQAQISAALFRAQLGQELEVLVEGRSKLANQASAARQLSPGPEAERNPVDGLLHVASTPRAPSGQAPARLVGRTRGDEIVAFDGPPELVGRIVRVRAVNATPLTILAELVDGTKPIGGPQDHEVVGAR